MGPPYLGPEIVKNGSFNTGADWNAPPGWIITDKASWNIPNAWLSNTPEADVYLAGKSYKVKFDISDCTPAAPAHFAFYPNYGNRFSFPFNVYVFLTPGHYEYTVTLSVYSTFIAIYSRISDGFPFSIDNISIKQIYP
jgi:hypothetical protein